VSRSYRIKAYLKHRRHARGRHGTHSPFVYAFVDQAFRKDTVPVPALTLGTATNRELINRIITYFGCRNIAWLTKVYGEPETFITVNEEPAGNYQVTSRRFSFDEYESLPSPDLLMLDMHDPTDWLPAYERYRHRLRDTGIVLVNGIHNSEIHSGKWQELHEGDEVRLSIDLYKAGLLFFRKEFLQKQHFFIKHKT